MAGIQSKRLPGRAQPADEALRGWQAAREEWIRTRADQAAARTLASFFIGDAEHMHRWRVRLDCGHIAEAVHSGKDQPPAEWRWRGLLPGEFRCEVPECREARSCPVRGIVSWDKLTAADAFPADPEERSGWLGGPPGKARTRIPEAGPRESAVWEVTLSCGHTADDVFTGDSSWTPAQGITRTPPKDDGERQRRDWMIQFYGAQGDEWTRRYVAEDFPEPVPWTTCRTCTRARKITAYQYIGALTRPQSPTPPPDPAEARAVLERELRKAERRVAKLRAELNSL